MKIVIARRTPGIAWSMDVYADNLIAEIQQLRPDWQIIQCFPKLKSWKSGTGLGKYYQNYWQYPRALCQTTGDIFHVLDHTDGHLVRWLRRAGKRMLVTCHDLAPLTYPETLRAESRLPWLSEFVWRRSVHGLKQADQILCVSASTEHDVAKHLQIPRRYTNVVHSGTNQAFRILPQSTIDAVRAQYCHPTQSGHPEQFSQPDKTAHPDKPYVLLHVGSNLSCKNLTGVLQSLKILRDRQIPAQLWQVGARLSDVQKQYVQQHNLADHITLIGNINPRQDLEQIIAIYNAADVTVFPSLYEGFGFPILESMACGTPVVTSNVFAMPEVADNAAILVNPADPNSIANGIAQLYANPADRRQLIRQGLKRVAQFSWRTTAQNTVQLYEQLYQARFGPLATSRPKALSVR